MFSFVKKPLHGAGCEGAAYTRPPTGIADNYNLLYQPVAKVPRHSTDDASRLTLDFDGLKTYVIDILEHIKFTRHYFWDFERFSSVQFRA